MLEELGAFFPPLPPAAAPGDHMAKAVPAAPRREPEQTGSVSVHCHTMWGCAAAATPVPRLLLAGQSAEYQ